MGYWTKEKSYQNRVLILAILEAKGGRIESSSKPFATEMLYDLVIANGGTDIRPPVLWNCIRGMDEYIDTLIIGKRTHVIEVCIDKVPANIQRDVENLMPTLRWITDAPVVAVEPTVEETTVVAPVMATGLSDDDVVRVALELLTQAVAMGSAPRVEVEKVNPNAWRETKEQNDKIQHLKNEISNLSLKNETLSKQQVTYLVRINALEADKASLEANLQAALKASANIGSQVRDGIEKVLLGAPKSAKQA